MLAELPEVSGRVTTERRLEAARTHRAHRAHRHRLVPDDEVDLGELKTSDGEVELRRHLEQGLKLDGQDLFIPARLLSEPVVGDHVSPLLFLAHVREANGRHLGHAEQLCCLDAAVTGDDHVSSSMRTGLLKPNAAMLSAIWRICRREWVRALRGLGFSSERERTTTLRSSSGRRPRMIEQGHSLVEQEFGPPNRRTTPDEPGRAHACRVGLGPSGLNLWLASDGTATTTRGGQPDFDSATDCCTCASGAQAPIFRWRARASGISSKLCRRGLHRWTSGRRLSLHRAARACAR